MGRGSSGVVKEKGTKYNAESAGVHTANVYQMMRNAVRMGTDTDSLESNYRKQVKLYPTAALEREHSRYLDNAAFFEDRKSDEARLSYRTIDKMEFIQRQELMRRNPKKYDADWYLNAVYAAKRKYKL